MLVVCEDRYICFGIILLDMRKSKLLKMRIELNESAGYIVYKTGFGIISNWYPCQFLNYLNACKKENPLSSTEYFKGEDVMMNTGIVFTEWVIMHKSTGETC